MNNNKYIYKPVLALANLQRLRYHKTNQTKEEYDP